MSMTFVNESLFVWNNLDFWLCSNNYYLHLTINQLFDFVKINMRYACGILGVLARM